MKLAGDERQTMASDPAPGFGADAGRWEEIK